MTRVAHSGLAGLAALTWFFASTSPAGADGTASQNGALSVPVPKPRSMAIEIISANYGHSGSAKSCVVTQSLKSNCNGRSRCVVKVADALCRPPSILPAELILTLNVKYRCTPVVAPRSAKADKPFQLVIDCGASTR